MAINLELPKKMQAHFSGHVQQLADEVGRELFADDIWQVFQRVYHLNTPQHFQLLDYEESKAADGTRLFAALTTVTGGTPTGNVTFFDGPTAIGTSSLNGSFQATLTRSTLTAGTLTVNGTVNVTLTGAATSPGLAGKGGVYCEESGLVTNCVIAGNAANYGDGGGAAGATVAHCTIRNNSAQADGGGAIRGRERCDRRSHWGRPHCRQSLLQQAE